MNTLKPDYRYVKIDEVIVGVRYCYNCPFMRYGFDGIEPYCNYPDHETRINVNADIDEGFPEECPLSSNLNDFNKEV